MGERLLLFSPTSLRFFLGVLGERVFALRSYEVMMMTMLFTKLVPCMYEGIRDGGRFLFWCIQPHTPLNSPAESIFGFSM